MKVRATESNTWPAGCHWSTGKVRDITLGEGQELPHWLVEVKGVKPETKTKKASEKTTTDEG